MGKWIRAGALGGARQLVEDVGGDFAALARDCELRADFDAHPDLPIAASAVPRLLDLAAQRLDCPTFGLQLGQRQDFSLFGPLGGRIANARTIGDLIANLAALFPLHTHGAIVALKQDGTDTYISYELSSDVHPSHRHVVELGYSVLIAEIRRHLPDWSPGFIAFRHAGPMAMHAHKQLLGAIPLFNADQNLMLLDKDMLACPLASRTPQRHVNAPALGSDMNPRTVALDTERVVRLALPARLLTVDDTAKLLGLARRTFQRQLATEGTTYEAIVDAVRADLALAYLRDSNLAVAEIAETLQFSETSALTRAVRRWHGKSPRRLR
jgi:AraC-like DNA-binding protein